MSDRNLAEQKCGCAIEELSLSFNNILKKENSAYWLMKYRLLNIGVMNYSEEDGLIDKFRSTYCELNKLNKLSNHHIKAIIALLEFNSFDKLDEDQLLKWLIKYENLGLDLEPYKWGTCIEDHLIPESGLIPLKHNRDISLYAQEYKDIFNFLDIFSKNYWHYAQLYSIADHNGYHEESGIKYYRETNLSLGEYLNVKKVAENI